MKLSRENCCLAVIRLHHSGPRLWSIDPAVHVQCKVVLTFCVQKIQPTKVLKICANTFAGTESSLQTRHGRWQATQKSLLRKEVVWQMRNNSAKVKLLEVRGGRCQQTWCSAAGTVNRHRRWNTSQCQHLKSLHSVVYITGSWKHWDGRSKGSTSVRNQIYRKQH